MIKLHFEVSASSGRSLNWSCSLQVKDESRISQTSREGALWASSKSQKSIITISSHHWDYTQNFQIIRVEFQQFAAKIRSSLFRKVSTLVKRQISTYQLVNSNTFDPCRCLDSSKPEYWFCPTHMVWTSTQTERLFRTLTSPFIVAIWRMDRSCKNFGPLYSSSKIYRHH